MPAMPELPAVIRLALAYAPVRERPAWQALFLLDLRLAGIVRGSREPLLAQIRLSWWRDRLREDPGGWPAGEPLLAALSGWGAMLPALAGLVDGWEALLGEPPLPPATFAAFADARARAIAALAVLLGAGRQEQAVRRMARGWALADLAGHLSEPGERAGALALARAHDWRRERLPRAMRPLVVLHALAKREVAGTPGAVARLLVAMRAGVFGV